MQILLFGVTIFVLSLLFPNNPGFNFKYEDAALWSYDDLYAPFDFPLKRSASQLDSVREEVGKQFIPYYKEDISAPERTFQFINSQFNQIHLDNDIEKEGFKVAESEQLYKQITSFLKRVYAKGVLQDTLPANFKQVGIFYLLKPNQDLVLQRVDNHFIPSQIRDSISLMFQSLEGTWIKDYESLFLEAIEPNIKFDEQMSLKFRNEEIQKISFYSGKIDKGELIVRRGGRISTQVVQKLESLKEKMTEEGYTTRAYWKIYAGNLLLSIIVMGLYYLYLFLKNHRY
jgi:membrane-associated HD superfamily phosphohydrolase